MFLSFGKGPKEALLSGIFAASAGSTAKLAFDKDFHSKLVHSCSFLESEFSSAAKVCLLFEVIFLKKFLTQSMQMLFYLKGGACSKFSFSDFNGLVQFVDVQTLQ